MQWTTAELVLKRLIVSGPDDDALPEHAQPDVARQLRAAERRYPVGRSRTPSRSAPTSCSIAQEPRRQQPEPRAVEGRDQAAARHDGQLPAGRHGRHRRQDSGGNYFDALHALGTLNTPTWTVGLNFNYPIGMAAAKAAYARAEIQRNQAIEGIKVTELQIATDVTNAGLAVQNSYLQLKAAQKSREAAEQNAAAEQTRFDVGMSNQVQRGDRAQQPDERAVERVAGDRELHQRGGGIRPRAASGPVTRQALGSLISLRSARLERRRTSRRLSARQNIEKDSSRRRDRGRSGRRGVVTAAPRRDQRRTRRPDAAAACAPP